MSREQGFSVMEVMIAAALGLAVIAVALELLGGVRQNQQLIQAHERLNQNARLAADWLRGALRQAGYPGCPRSAWRVLSPVGETTATPAVAATVAEGGAPGSDAMALQRLRSVGTAAVRSGVADGARIALDRPHGIAPQQLVLAVFDHGAHCVLFRHVGQAADVLDRGPGADGTGNRVPQAGYLPVSGRIELFVPERVVYFVAPASHATGVNSLYRRRRSAGGRREELVVGVADLQIRYGVDADADGAVEGFREAAAVIDWREVSAVELTMRVGARQHASLPLVEPDGLYRSLQLVVRLRNAGP